MTAAHYRTLLLKNPDDVYIYEYYNYETSARISLDIKGVESEWLVTLDIPDKRGCDAYDYPIIYSDTNGNVERVWAEFGRHNREFWDVYNLFEKVVKNRGIDFKIRW